MAMSLHQFLCLTDNYGVLAHDPGTGATASIDAPEAGPILAALKEKGWTLTHLLITHHHADHVQGAPELKAKFPSLTIIGPAKEAARIPVPRYAGRRGRFRPRRIAGGEGDRDAGPYARPGQLSFRGRGGRLLWRHAVFARLRASVRSPLRRHLEFAGQARRTARRDQKSIADTNIRKRTAVSPSPSSRTIRS